MSWQLAGFFFFAGVVSCILFSKIMGLLFAKKVIETALCFSLLLSRQMVSLYPQGEEKAEGLKTNSILLFYKLLPKNLHPLIPFKNWDEAMIWLEKKERSW